MTFRACKKVIIVGLAMSALACGESDTQGTPVVSHAKSLTAAGAPQVEKTKTLSTLDESERKEFVRAVNVRISNIINSPTVFENLCAFSGAMAGLSYASVPGEAANAEGFCQDVTAECNQGAELAQKNFMKIEADVETFNCDVPVEAMLGCLEETSKVMEAFRDVANNLTCSDPKAGIQDLVSTLKRLSPNAKDCKDVQAACPQMVGTSGDVNTSVHEGPSVEAEIVTSPDSAPGLNPEIQASQDDAGQGDTPNSPDDASDNLFGGADDSSDDDDEWNPEDDGAFGGEGADEPDFGDDDFDDDDDF